MFGYLLGGLLLEVTEPRPLIVGCGAAGLLVLLGFVGPVRRVVRAECARDPRMPAGAASAPGAGLATSVAAR
ncbi:hypothetical protein [Micromonospora tarapacensis]|uniref:hypothetical protein n=1 Tax=Micromonospora tarapacensis TaxID=2835305 RepID=UPI001E6154A2|nr:hypothetical protein [Micromonospora tarapacensis]